MTGLGTIINCAAIIVGGLLGMLFKKGLTVRFQETVMSAVGLAVLFIGAGGSLVKIFSYSDGKFSATGTYMMIASLVLGSLVGELINLDKHAVTFGNFLKRKFKSEKDKGFTDGFVVSSLTVCVGAMAVVGSIADGLTGDYLILATKAILDCIIVLILASSYGKGCIFSAIPVFVLQGSITLLSRLISPVLTDAAVSNISLVGSMLIFCVGINLMFDKKIKVANMLPSLIFAAAYSFLPFE